MISYRRATADDLTELNKLNPVGEGNWRSEFWDNRMPDGIVCVCENEEGLTGVEGYMGGYPLLKSGRIYKSHRSERTLVLPSMRGKGVFVNLVDQCHRVAMESDSAFCWGATSAIKPFEKAGFKGFEKWRKYYFIGFKPWYKSAGIVKFLRLLQAFGQFRVKRSLENMLLLGTITCDFVPRLSAKKSNLIGSEVDFEVLSKISREVIADSQGQYDDFALQLSKGFLSWLGSRGIEITCVAIRTSSQTVGYVCYKQTNGYILIEDFGVKSGVDIGDLFGAFSRFLRDNSESPDVGSFVLPLNMRNGFHEQVAKALPRPVISTPALGSFVVKPGKRSPDISELRLTPIWLEL